MKKLLIFPTCLLLSACTWGPQFHKNEQVIHLSAPKSVNLAIEGNESNAQQVQVERSFFDLKGTLSKEGFENKDITIKSHWTNDKWAVTCGKGSNSKVCVNEDASAWRLLPPQTIILPFEVGYEIINSCEGFKCSFVLLSPLAIITGAAQDVFSLVTLSWPRAVLGNPWYEYDKEVDLSKEILTPTLEFATQCHNKEGMFIGNNDCVSCTTRDLIVSTHEECERCSNREWSNLECRLRTK